LYKDKFKATWLNPWGFNNTYVLAVRKEDADRLRLARISDLATTSASMSIGTTQEFAVRPDGLPGLTKHYAGVSFKDTKPRSIGLITRGAKTSRKARCRKSARRV
jgi:glycine betaine/choline ABC-type transport system substrate-binding protein